jgi:tetratricopeptide (TPR) repeat protein
MKYTPFLIVLLLTLFNSNIYSQVSKKPFVKLVEEVEKSIVLINGYDSNNKLTSQGTGFFIESNGICITNYHVLEGCFKASIKFENIEIQIDKIIDYNIAADIIKFSINNKNNVKYPTVSLISDLPKKGEEVFVIGNPLGLDKTVSKGIVSSLRENLQFGSLIQITAPISSGSSGSPVFNYFGEVIGIATMSYDEGQNLNFAVSSSKLQSLNGKKNIQVNDLKNEDFMNDDYKKALSEYLKNNNIESLKIVIKLIELNPRNHLAYSLEGQILLDNKMYENAIESFFHALENDLSNVAYYNSFAYANAKYSYFLGGDEDSFSTAFNAYSKAIEIDEKYFLAYINKAWLIYNHLFSTGISKKFLKSESIFIANDLINKFVNYNKSNANGYFLRSQINFRLNNLTASQEDIDKAISLDNTNFQYHFFKGELNCFGFDNPSNGITNLSKALDLATNNEDKADILGMRSIAYFKLNNSNKACADARKAISLSSKGFYKELVSKVCR